MLHKITEKSLKKFGLFERVRSNPNIELRPRTDYFSFIRLLRGSQFVVSDGGSTQEECSYMGIPTLLLRKATERHDGLGSNVVLSHYDIEVIKRFLKDIANYRRSVQANMESPADIIANHMKKLAATTEEALLPAPNTAAH